MLVHVLKSSYTQNQIWRWLLLWTTQRWVQSLKLWEVWNISTERNAKLQLFVLFPQIQKTPPVRFDSRTLCISAYSGKLCYCCFWTCYISVPSKSLQVTLCIDAMHCYAVTSDLLVTNCMSFSSSSSVFVVERLACLSSGDWSAFLQQVCAVLETVERAGSGTTTTPRAKLNLLCYLCCVCGHRDTATRFMHSQLVSPVWVHITHNFI